MMDMATSHLSVIGSILALVGCSLLRGDDRKVGSDELPPPAAGKVDFAKDIKPIFERSCIQCHSTPEVIVTMNRARNRGGLSLSSREEALRGGNNIGIVIVPGKSAESPLIHLVSGFPDKKTQVPAMPPREKDRLSKEEIGKLRAWIDQGAVWPKMKGEMTVEPKKGGKHPEGGGRVSDRCTQCLPEFKRPFQIRCAVDEPGGTTLTEVSSCLPGSSYAHRTHLVDKPSTSPRAGRRGRRRLAGSLCRKSR
jgi:hypothetical protein